jgi:hypothetical protein
LTIKVLTQGVTAMEKLFLLILICGMLSACGEIRIPVKAETDKDEVFKGEIIASLTEGSAHLASKSGVTCNGTYDQFSTEQVVMMYMSCSDGRHGKITATRDLPLGSQSGIGMGKMNDGTQVTFAWGNRRISEMDQ